MQNRILKIAVALTGLAAAASIWLLSGHAQENKRNQGAALITTNWLGCVVVGNQDSMDPIGQGPFPQCIPQFQLGLRSDGVVVWRPATPASVSIQRR
jgi:hypothetical protein